MGKHNSLAPQKTGMAGPLFIAIVFTVCLLGLVLTAHKERTNNWLVDPPKTSTSKAPPAPIRIPAGPLNPVTTTSSPHASKNREQSTSSPTTSQSPKREKQSPVIPTTTQ